MRSDASYRLVGFLGIAFFGASAFTSLPNIVDRSAAVAPQLESSDAIVVLASGGVAAVGILSTSSAVRALHGIALYRMGLAPILAFSGGHGEAEARADLARRQGVPPEAILTQTTARTTYEEAQRMRDTLRPRGVRTIVLVAHSFDLVRARPLFERVGFQVRPGPPDALIPPATTPEARLILMRSLLKELSARLYYRLTRSI